MWAKPSELGTPPLSGYIIQLSSDSGLSNLVALANATMFEISGLIPWTSYTVNVTASSSFEFMNDSANTSVPVMFTTLRGGKYLSIVLPTLPLFYDNLEF